jgi:hypothetical protein
MSDKFTWNEARMYKATRISFIIGAERMCILGNPPLAVAIS